MKPRIAIGLTAIMLAALAGEASAQEAVSRAARSASSAPAFVPPPVVIYTKDNAPATPKLEDLPLKESVTQYGITWTFEKPARAGRFVCGDWYVVGPVTVKSIDPRPLFGEECPNVDDAEAKAFKGKYCRNGSVLNLPPTNHACGWDSRIRHNIFDPDLPARLPIAMKPGDALVSTISKGQLTRGKHYGAISSVAILTCLKEPVPADAFRPGPMDRRQPIYRASSLKRELLPRLERQGLPELKSGRNTPSIAMLVEHFWRPWMDLCIFNEDHAPYQWNGYGQRPTFYLCQALLILCLDFTPEEKEPLLLCTVQRGIDLWGMCKAGHPGWPAWGGWNSGRKAPIVLAGMLLGDETMASPSKTCPRVSFQEDEQTMYGRHWAGGAMVLFAGHSGVSCRAEEDREKNSRHKWGPFEHIHPAQWAPDNDTSDAYRRCCTSRTWPGEALAMRLLKAEKHWDHDAFFDYVDRWMYEDEGARLAEQAKARGKEVPEWARQGQVEDPFAEAMWKKYRTAPGMPPTDGWKKERPNPPRAPAPAGSAAGAAPPAAPVE